MLKFLSIATHKQYIAPYRLTRFIPTGRFWSQSYCVWYTDKLEADDLTVPSVCALPSVQTMDNIAALIILIYTLTLTLTLVHGPENSRIQPQPVLVSKNVGKHKILIAVIEEKDTS